MISMDFSVWCWMGLMDIEGSMMLLLKLGYYTLLDANVWYCLDNESQTNLITKMNVDIEWEEVVVKDLTYEWLILNWEVIDSLSWLNVWEQNIFSMGNELFKWEAYASMGSVDLLLSWSIFASGLIGEEDNTITLFGPWSFKIMIILTKTLKSLQLLKIFSRDFKIDIFEKRSQSTWKDYIHFEVKVVRKVKFTKVFIFFVFSGFWSFIFCLISRGVLYSQIHIEDYLNPIWIFIIMFWL